MENEIKVGEWIRTDNGIIGKYVKYRGIEDTIETNNKWIGSDIERDIVKHSPNLIDLIKCEDYVNGYRVINILYKNEKELPTIIKCLSEHCFKEDDIKEVVTKEMMESISYKVERNN